MSVGAFYWLEANSSFPAHLSSTMPPFLWLPTAPQAADGTETLLTGHPLGPKPGRPIVLATQSSDGPVRLHFDVAQAAEGILLERYHPGLEPTIEMRLPFNYSWLPPWVKGMARWFRRGGLAAQPEVAFPSEQAPFVVEWLRELGRWAGQAPSPRSLAAGWPDGCRAALAISYDVDTDWLFENPVWLERICDMQERHGLFGAFYCVPMYSQGPAAIRALHRLRERGCEVGCHGYNHDAKLPLLQGERLAHRLQVIRDFSKRWDIRGFRSEWLWRTPDFLRELADLFAYDSSLPAVQTIGTRYSGSGCGSCLPYRTHGDLVELPLALPFDEQRHLEGLDPAAFWQRQVRRAEAVIDRGGLVMLALHPQPHQAANAATLEAIDDALAALTSIPNLWLARPDQIAEWVEMRLPARAAEPVHESV